MTMASVEETKVRTIATGVGVEGDMDIFCNRELNMKQVSVSTYRVGVREPYEIDHEMPTAVQFYPEGTSTTSGSTRVVLWSLVDSCNIHEAIHL